ncbi:MAG TPA: glutamine-hydrolyzing carbamoyl-phosphate synthase small subunit [Oculatellaceae cyanobacterium]
MSTHDASQHSSTSNRSVLDPSGPPCLLALEDGKCFTGMLFGAPGTVKGELVFNTSLIGYQEILTDPSYAGQVVTLTYPEIGNYGTSKEDIESTSGGVHARGLVIRHLSRQFSSWRGEGHLTEFMVKHNVIGISGVDTRAVTRHIRDKGAMRCAISSEILDPKELVKVAVGEAAMEGADFTGEVTTDKIYKIGSGKNQVAVIDYGIKKNILNQLSRGDNTLTVYPADTKADVILADRPAALFLSNGPGDPAACKDIIAELAKLIEARLPIFGICLGHQLLAIALGASTYKLKFGHRGGNQPVKDLVTGKIEITCQNHGFAVDVESLPTTMELTHINLNDQSVEGFRHKELPIFGIQYHPESSPGPHDSNYLFDRFFEMIESQRKVSV